MHSVSNLYISLDNILSYKIIMKPLVVIGFLGSTLDAAKFGPSRWNKWRPSLSIAMQEDLRIDRFVLLHGKLHSRLADQIAEDIESVSPETTVDQKFLEFDDPWEFEEVYGKLLDFARDYPFDPDKEDYLIHITTGTHVAQICLFLLTEARYLPGRLLQTQPGGSVKGNVLGRVSMIDLDLSRYDSIASRFSIQTAEDSSFLKSGIETKNHAFNTLIDEIEQVAGRSKAPILLTGPTGAGKSQLARRIYELKKLKHQVSGRFVEVNCATLRGDSAMSALFGHTKGAFTGAASERAGLLRTADNGMLFLDEIGELGADEQAMILRAIEEKRFLPVGADSEVESDFQLIAGTNKDLSEAVSNGLFRDDLLARLNLWTFALPGLAERKEDIEPNLDYELDRYAEREGSRVTFNKEARDRYLNYATSSLAKWPGNFRDLAASVTRMATLSPEGRIDRSTADMEIGKLNRLWDNGAIADADGLAKLLDYETLNALDPFDRVQLNEVIRVCGESKNMSEAGRTLFASSRKRRKSSNDADRLKKYLARFDLNWQLVSK
ncbi:RNA repair transcriptional activator RtcR [Parasphingorhabdus sp.]|uniref:RNA repair transcriptional activator RtcR n=1 Tax=Parasphingorhabdus sp. TaxID=2709688 RepID=UPI0032653242